MIHTICRKNISLCVKYIQFFNRFLQSIHVFIIACVDLGLYKYISYLKYKRRNRGGGGRARLNLFLFVCQYFC